MKRGTLTLVLCGIVGAVTTAGLVFAQEGFRLSAPNSAKQSNSSSQYFSRGGTNTAASNTTSAKPSNAHPLGGSNSGSFSGKAPDGFKSSTKVIEIPTRRGQKSATPENVIRAEYQSGFDAPVGGTIKMISSSNTSPFGTAKNARRAQAFPSNLKPAAPMAAPTAARIKTTLSGAQTALVTVQWVKLSDINVGLECECGLVVKNNGKTSAEHVAIVASFPTTVRLTSAKPMPQEIQGQLLWKITSLAAGEKKTIRVKMIPSKRGALNMKASVRFTTAAAESFTVAEPMIKIQITGLKEVLIGDSASQVIIVTNPGTGVATNVKIEARIPKGLEHPRGERLVMEIGSLNPGESRKVRLALSAVKGGKQTVFVQASSDVALKQQLSKEVIVVEPSIKVAMKGPSLRYLGRKAVYEIGVTNDGTGATNNMRVLHRVPAGFKFLSADKGGKYNNETRTLSWFVGRVEPGQTVKVKVALDAAKLGSQTHLVGAITEQGAKSETSFKTKIDGTSSLVLEITDLDDPVEVGAETAYEVRIRNAGTKAASKVSLSCELPAGVTLLEAKGPTGSIAENGLVVFKALGELKPGKTAIYRIKVIGTQAGNQRFRARLASESIRKPLTYEELTKFYVD